MAKHLISMVIFLSFSSSAWAATLEAKDFLGRVMVMDQVHGQIQGVLEFLPIKSSRHHFEVTMRLNVNETHLKGECVGSLKTDSRDPQFVNQFLTIACPGSGKIETHVAIFLDLKDISSYLSGSFLGARLTIMDKKNGRRLADNISVDLKNLDF